MTDDAKKDDKIIGVKVTLDKCAHGDHMHVTDVAPLRESDVVYNAPDADETLSSSKSLRWSRAYVDNWERNFGTPSDAEVN